MGMLPGITASAHGMEFLYDKDTWEPWRTFVHSSARTEEECDMSGF